ncbi:hypothetical protein LF41_589 [Lysobacter dokdonensis DS-58]|uniref:Uncharacterized protein n=1 Tax=Lysobacter dokdonensis DS-58 TaxID=1300345 RepID=A0A0A2WFN7_9GAMM|nr:hypothetical protein [Lysobacter dokdonensis]KGQ18563.1 hypothetical protein LF41_589 [Lysobacter dokdonensis DS-58]
MGNPARLLAWLVCACVGLVILGYAALIAINWSDEAPSKDDVALQQIVASKPDVPDAANAWVFLLGMDVPEGQDPLAWGIQRKAFLERYTPPKEGEYAFLPGREHQYQRARSSAITTLSEACKTGTAECARLVQGDFAQVDGWLASEHWLLERYVRMQGLREWKEVVGTDVSTPSPRFSPALHGQQLMFMQAWQQARAGDGEAARAALDRDFTFWRMALRSSDTLIAKMIATSALKRNLTVGNLVLRDLHAAGKPAAPPAAWTQPITREEYSMRRVFAGEYVFRSTGLAALVDKPGLMSPNKVKDALERPFFQPQATNNMTARDFVRLSDRLDVDYPAIPGAIAASHRESSATEGTYHAYNFFGHILHDIGMVNDLDQYAVRASDIEGVRRAALLAAELRETHATASDAAPRVHAARWQNPYTNAPFAWDATTGSVVFTGLERNERGTHALML